MSRKVRIERGQGIALGRLALGRLRSARRCLIPDTFEVSSNDKAIQHLELRSHILEFIAQEPHKAGVKMYHGDLEKNEFRKWFPRFVKLERVKLEKKKEKLTDAA